MLVYTKHWHAFLTPLVFHFFIRFFIYVLGINVNLFLPVIIPDIFVFSHFFLLEALQDLPGWETWKGKFKNLVSQQFERTGMVSRRVLVTSGLLHCVCCKSKHQGTRHRVVLDVKALYPVLGLFGGTNTLSDAAVVFFFCVSVDTQYIHLLILTIYTLTWLFKELFTQKYKWFNRGWPYTCHFARARPGQDFGCVLRRSHLFIAYVMEVYISGFISEKQPLDFMLRRNLYVNFC